MSNKLTNVVLGATSDMELRSPVGWPHKAHSSWPDATRHGPRSSRRTGTRCASGGVRYDRRGADRGVRRRDRPVGSDRDHRPSGAGGSESPGIALDLNLGGPARVVAAVDHLVEPGSVCIFFGSVGRVHCSADDGRDARRTGRPHEPRPRRAPRGGGIGNGDDGLSVRQFGARPAHAAARHLVGTPRRAMPLSRPGCDRHAALRRRAGNISRGNESAHAARRAGTHG